jgi:hypothetical protein
VLVTLLIYRVGWWRRVASGCGSGQSGAAAFASGEGGAAYRRHRPEQTLLYQVVARHYREFAALMEAEERPLPGFVRREFEAFLKCGRLEHGFLRVRCEDCRAETLVAFSWPLPRIHAPAAFVIPFTSQASRILPELRCTSHGGYGGAAGGRSAS